MGSIFRYLAFLGAFGVAGFYCFTVFQGPNGYHAYVESRQQIQRMKDENEKLRAQIREKRVTIEKLESSEAAREKAIQEITNKAKGDSTVIYLNDGPADTQ
jgi:cell division protein FtsB